MAEALKSFLFPFEWNQVSGSLASYKSTHAPSIPERYILLNHSVVPASLSGVYSNAPAVYAEHDGFAGAVADGHIYRQCGQD